jgi:hypothetical protein
MRHRVEPQEQFILHQFCSGKTLITIAADHRGVTLLFSDGSLVMLSTPGGVEIKELIEKEVNEKTTSQEIGKKGI